LTATAVPTLPAEVRLEPNPNRFAITSGTSLYFKVLKWNKRLGVLGHVVTTLQHRTHLSIFQDALNDRSFTSPCCPEIDWSVVVERPITFAEDEINNKAHQDQSDRFHFYPSFANLYLTIFKSFSKEITPADLRQTDNDYYIIYK